MELAREAAAALGPVEATPEGFLTTLKVPAEATVLAGHFPGQPVVPAVYLIEAACAAALKAKGAGPLKGIRQAKFLRQVLPEVEVELRGSLEGTAEGWVLDVEISLKGERAAFLCLELGSRDPG
ncbi:MAG: hypothetical protein JKY65_12605 [Planctomycetes bacterium]|nr:hypothetical protein [Planctomycetota bacterium]